MALQSDHATCTSYSRSGSSSRTGQPSLALPTQDVGRARTHFLSSKPVSPHEVRLPVLSSWRRSLDHRVSVDELITPYEEDLDLQGPLVHASAPVLDTLCSQLSNQAVSIVLTDADGYVLDRRTGERHLENYLDRVCLAPGFSYAEHHVGTNGIGTALEAGRATLVHEQEHYASPLTGLSCAGVPIHDPITGALAGVLDLTCFSEDVNPLLMGMAASAAYSIQVRMLDQNGGDDVALLQDYLRASRRSSDPVLAVNDNVVMMNTEAQAELTTQDQSFVVERLRDGLRADRTTVDLDLPSGMRCRLFVKRVADTHSAGKVGRVQLLEPLPLALPRATPRLPGIVGSGNVWRRCCRELDGHYQDGNWVLLVGEPGTGKTALAESISRHHHPGSYVRVYDGESSTAPRRMPALDDLPDATGTIVIRNIDRLNSAQLAELTAFLDALTESGRRDWVTATARQRSRLDTGDASGVLRFFPQTVEVPPLRHHVEDVEEIANFLLQRITKRREARFSGEALRILMRRHWPGNVAELRDMVQLVARRTRARTIFPEDLPAQCKSQNRRILTPLESLERDAIVNSLVEASGNRSQAARLLGISRATIYRKISEYGIKVK